MSASQYFGMPTRCTRSTLATMDITPPPFLSLTTSTAVADAVDHEIKTSPISQEQNGIHEVPTYDEDYDEDVGGGGDEARDKTGAENYSGSADPTPVGAKNKATDKRKFGGSSKGRKCYRWTPKQEAAAIEGMLEIRAEGEIIGDLCFEELYKRLVAKFPDWNHSVSGIHNAWHRRDLVHRVHRAEARAVQQKRLQQEKEDEELGLTIKGKRALKRKSTGKLATPTKHGRATNTTDEETDDEAIITSKCRRMRSSGSFTGSSLRNIDTTLSCDLSATSLFTIPATMLPAPDIPDFPTVTIGFKRYNNSSHRTREFAYVNTVHRFWNQVVATPMFNNLDTDFMVVTVWINEIQKPHHMAQHDKFDYTNFLRLVERAVDASGEEEVVINVTAAL